MGFLNKKPIIKNEGFRPIDLNEDNVQAIFNRCLVSSESEQILRVTLFSAEYEFEKEDEFVVDFDPDAIKRNSAAIAYLYGQLHDVVYSEVIDPSSAAINYESNVWTKDIRVILKFLALGQAAHMFRPFVKVEPFAAAVLLPILPTYSPKDPYFPTWWEEHKSEWEA